MIDSQASVQLFLTITALLSLLAACAPATPSVWLTPALTAEPTTEPTAPLPTPPWAATPLEDQALVEALRQGGFVIFFRHATTDRSQRDSEQNDLSDCTLQRNLNDVGISESRQIGEAFTVLRIPVGQVLSSGFCRCWQTANGAFGRYQITDDLKSVTVETMDLRVSALRRLLATTPEPGTNTVLVSHGNNISNAAGVPLTEGEAAVFRPIASGYELVATVTPEGWWALVV